MAGGEKLTEAYVDIVVRMGDLDKNLKEVNAKVKKHVNDVQKVQVDAAKKTADDIESAETKAFKAKLDRINYQAARLREVLRRAAERSRQATPQGRSRSDILNDPTFANVGSSWVADINAWRARNRAISDHVTILERLHRAQERLRSMGGGIRNWLFGSGDGSGVSRAAGHYSQFARNLNAVGRAIQGVGQAAMVANGPLGRLGLSLGTIMQGVGRLIGNFNLAGAASAGMAASFLLAIVAVSALHSALVILTEVALAGVIAKITPMLMKFESLRHALSATMGSTQGASDEIKSLEVVAKLPGLTLEDAIKGSVALQSVGETAEQARFQLYAFGNALAISGGGAPELEDVNQQLIQIMTRSSVSERNINALGTHLPQIREMMQRAFGTQSAEGIRAMGISGREFVDRLSRAFAELPPMADTLQNKWDNAIDSMKRAVVKLLPLVEPIITRITQIIERIGGNLEEQFGSRPEELAQMGERIADAIETIAAGVWGFIVGLFGLFGTNINDWVDAVNKFIDTLNRMGAFIYSYGYAIGRVFTFILNMGRSVMLFFKMVAEGLATMLGYVLALIWSAIGLITGGITGMKNNFMQVHTWIQRYLIGGIVSASEEWTRLTQAMMAPWAPPAWKPLQHMPAITPPKPPAPYGQGDFTGETNVRWSRIEEIGKNLAVRAAQFGYQEDMLDNSRRQTGYLGNIAESTRRLAATAGTYNQAWDGA